MRNPLWDAVKKLPPSKLLGIFMRGGKFSPDMFDLVNYQDHRFALARKYSWAISGPESVEFVARACTPENAVEIGAGNGYWAGLLAQRGIDVVAYDDAPPGTEENTWIQRGAVFHEIRKGGTESAALHPDRTLFLCWPPYDTSMAVDALRAYRGRRLVYIGEGEGGCTGDDDFFVLLAEEWKQVGEHEIVQWAGIHDRIEVFDRIGCGPLDARLELPSRRYIQEDD